MRKQILILLGFSFSLIACQQNEEIGSVEDNANPNEQMCIRDSYRSRYS